MGKALASLLPLLATLLTCHHRVACGYKFCGIDANDAGDAVRGSPRRGGGEGDGPPHNAVAFTLLKRRGYRTRPNRFSTFLTRLDRPLHHPLTPPPYSSHPSIIFFKSAGNPAPPTQIAVRRRRNATTCHPRHRRAIRPIMT